MYTFVVALALATSSAPAPPPPVDAGAAEDADAGPRIRTRRDYIRDCAEFLETGDPAILGIVDESGSASLAAAMICGEYPEALPIVAARARERAFQSWYAAISKRLGMTGDPDDERHCYDYRGFFDGLRAGKLREPRRPGQFPNVYMKPCHALYNAD